MEFPDFPGCVTQGHTLDEARAMAEDALAGHVELMLEEGEALPAPTPAGPEMSGEYYLCTLCT